MRVAGGGGLAGWNAVVVLVLWGAAVEGAWGAPLSLESASLQIAAAILWFHERLVLVILVASSFVLVAIGASAWGGNFQFRWLANVFGSLMIVVLSANLVGYLLLDEGSGGTTGTSLGGGTRHDACVGCVDLGRAGAEIGCEDEATCARVPVDRLPESEEEPEDESLIEAILDDARVLLEEGGLGPGMLEYERIMAQLEEGLSSFREGDRVHKVVRALGPDPRVEYVLCRSRGDDSGCALLGRVGLRDDGVESAA